ncbi:hypothetical protein CIL05_09875 [Virgibacillus profundi]|uniref:YesK-like protein n=1 Tax=Virgibacillus profundi TaxID=2024555 RepID=A0A2A2IDL6_9BACI|nr:YesK family protein [Virgibacillus profundi]PAV29672.1 hypothetical protein CIL05_09875 [Virgibacillus profundi]PXY53844.1 hypothetical protein CIT14_09970 [Virgibacillus profundi]
MSNFLIISIITAILLLGISFVFSKKKSSMRYIIPLIVTLISVLLIIISFFVSDWTGMGIGLYGFAIFIGSAFALIITAFVTSARDLKKNIR